MTSFDEVLELKEKGDIESLIFNLNNEDVNIRAFVVQALGYLGDIIAVDPLIEALKDQSVKVRKESIMSLSTIGDVKAVDPLIEALKDENSDVRERAAFALGELGDKRAYKYLVELLNDDNVKVREIAFFSLESLKNESDYNVKDILEQYKKKLGLNIEALDLFRTPQNIVDFIGRIVAIWHPLKILDPASNSGSLICGINSILGYGPELHVFNFNKDFFHLEKDKIDLNFNMHFSDFFSEKSASISDFDLIVSDLVLYYLLQNINFKSNNFKIALLTHSLDLLNNNGILIFIVPEKFLYSSDYHRLRNFLFNYSIEAVISIPISYLHPYGIKTSILIIKNSEVKNNNIFFAEYKKNHTNEIIKNFKSNISNNNVSQGFFVDSKFLKNNIWTFEFLSGFEEFRTEIKSKDLTKLSEIVNIVETTESNNNLLLIPKYSDNVLLLSELEEERFDDYFLCEVIDKSVIPEYLKLYLNSEEGKKNVHLSKNHEPIDGNVIDLMYVRIPEVEIQEKIFEADQKILDLKNKVDTIFFNFQNKLSNYPNILEISSKLDETDYKELLYDNFIWPLATSHYIATKGSPNVNSQLDNYFKLFELIAAFNSIILLSAMPKDFYIKNRSNIFPEKFRSASFGDWVYLYRRLGSIFAENQNNELFFDSIPFDNVFYKNIIGKKIFNILDEATNIRNETTGHGGVIPEIIAKNYVMKLTPGLNEIFKRMNFFNDLELIHTISLKKKNGLYNIEVRELKGTKVHFPIKQIESREDMDTELLYLYDPNSDERLGLSPELINLYECPICGRWALYLYSKITSKKAIYKSYQAEPHTKSLSIGPVKEFLGV